MKIKTSELTGSALDWTVAKCEGVQLKHGLTDDERYSTDWSQGGPIIEREKINISAFTSKPLWQAEPHTNHDMSMYLVQTGLTPLIAAMRCFVASKLGDFVDVPEELTK